jgi:hypothetical protein
MQAGRVAAVRPAAAEAASVYAGSRGGPRASAIFLADSAATRITAACRQKFRNAACHHKFRNATCHLHLLRWPLAAANSSVPCRLPRRAYPTVVPLMSTRPLAIHHDMLVLQQWQSIFHGSRNQTLLSGNRLPAPSIVSTSRSESGGSGDWVEDRAAQENRD